MEVTKYSQVARAAAATHTRNFPGTERKRSMDFRMQLTQIREQHQQKVAMRRNTHNALEPLATTFDAKVSTGRSDLYATP